MPKTWEEKKNIIDGMFNANKRCNQRFWFIVAKLLRILHKRNCHSFSSYEKGESSAKSRPQPIKLSVIDIFVIAVQEHMVREARFPQLAIHVCVQCSCFCCNITTERTGTRRLFIDLDSFAERRWRAKLRIIQGNLQPCSRYSILVVSNTSISISVQFYW